MNGNFLHIHSHFSINDSAQSPDDIVRRVKELGGKNVTLTDHRTLLGVDSFMAAGKKYGINTIPGVENEVILPEEIARILAGEDEAHLEQLRKMRNHLLLIPFDYEGFQTISFATRDANTNIFYIGSKQKRKAFPCLTDEMLEKHFKGNAHLFATSACIQGPIAALLLLNFRLRIRMEKQLGMQAGLKADYEAYNAAEEVESARKGRVKELKKQVTAESKPLKKPHQNKIERLRTKLASFADTPESTAYIKTQNELALAENLVELATTAVAALEQQITQLEQEQRLAAQVKANAKKAHGQYQRALTKLQAFRSFLVDDELLYATAKKRLLYLKSIFPNFFLEFQNHGLPEEAYVMPILLKLADETNTPIIAANDAHITSPSEQDVEARRLVRFSFFDRTEELTPQDREMYIKSEEELISTLAQIIPEDRAREAVQNTKILEQCHVVFPHDPHYPKVSGGLSFDETLEQARQKRIKEGLWNDAYQSRLEHEIKVIKAMGYVDYHMVVEQFCRIGRLMGRVPQNRKDEVYDHFPDLEEWVESQGFDIGVGVGPGRGSAAGSLVCYLLGITNIDPIKYKLLFERFLNPERVSMPDIDTDIATWIRPILIAYLRWYYGENAVCSIATVSTYGPKAAIKLVGRDRAGQLFDAGQKLEISQYQHEKTYALSDMVPNVPGTTMASCEADILPKISGDSEMLLLWERAKLIENHVSGTGVHAGGVIISDNQNVNDYVPLAWNDEKNVWVAQCDMVMAEAKGLIKMDVLGLNNLDIMNTCIHLIKRYHGISIDINRLPFEPEVFARVYATGNTNGIFQVESGGMKQMLRDFKPTCFEDIILMVAAYRPGPMQYLPDVIAVKNGKKELTFKHPMLESILSETYGACIYQESVMEIFQKLAGYSLGGADLVRRAMSKKKMDKLAQEREAFLYGDPARRIDGCIKRGISKDIANEIFDEMMEFAKYAFNRSHAAAYALVSYQTAWLKYHYPAEYLCALLTCEGQDKIASIVADCGAYGVELLPPDINSSFYQPVVENGCIRYGIGCIKGIGEANEEMIDRICEERKRGYFTGIQDFLRRTATAEEKRYTPLPNKLLTTCVNAGMFDSLLPDRKAILDAVAAAEIYDASVISRELFEERVNAISIPTIRKDLGYNYAKEMELLGTICSERPLSAYGTDEAYGCDPISNLESLDGQDATVFGFVIEAKHGITKKGKPFTKIRLQGKTGECEILFMGNHYAQPTFAIEDYLNSVVRIRARVKETSLFGDNIQYLTPEPCTYFIDLPDLEAQNLLMTFQGIRRVSQSADDVKLYMQIHYLRDGTAMSRPRLLTRFCSQAFIDKIKKLGIVCIKQ